MADNAESSSGSATLTFKVKSSGDKTHTVTMAESATVMELKTKLAGEDFENIPAERQRLIYSGRVMKNDEALSTYKIKAGNTVHMVKSAPSNPTASASTTTPQAVPQNMAAGTAANNVLAGLTGARFAGHANLPSRDLFGADGGMGAPPNEDQMADMLSNPAIAQTLNEALNNPSFIDYMIQATPMLANMPNAREMMQSPYFRQMMTNPDALRMAARMRRAMGGNGAPGGFPAPGATDTTPEGAAASDAAAGAGAGAGAGSGQNPMGFAFPPGMFGAPGGAGDAANPFAALMNPFGAPPPQGQGANSAATPAAGQAATGEQADGAAAQRGAGDAAAQGTAAQNPQANPFASLLAGMPGMPGAAQAGAAGGAGGAAPPNPFGAQGITPEMMQQMMQMWGPGGMGGGGMGGFGAPTPASPPDNRPPEERYADQLRQLNDMGFYDFDRNVAALRRSGGSVQGAVEHLLSGP